VPNYGAFGREIGADTLFQRGRSVLGDAAGRDQRSYP